MAILVFQYKEGTAAPPIQDDFESPASPPVLSPFVGENDTFTSFPDMTMNPTEVGELTFFGEANSTAATINPVVESETAFSGGHMDENAWWVNNFGDSDCDTELNQIVLIAPIPSWYTTPQYTNRYIFLDVGDPC